MTHEIHDSDLVEISHLFLSFCTFVSLTQGKKLNIPNIFLLVLKNKQIRAICKKKFETDSNYDVVNIFLKFDPSLYKSKYVMKYLNKTGTLTLT